jgi:hypothetical protein
MNCGRQVFTLTEVAALRTAWTGEGSRPHASLIIPALFTLLVNGSSRLVVRG